MSGNNVVQFFDNTTTPVSVLSVSYATPLPVTSTSFSVGETLTNQFVPSAAYATGGLCFGGLLTFQSSWPAGARYNVTGIVYYVGGSAVPTITGSSCFVFEDLPPSSATFTDGAAAVFASGDAALLIGQNSAGALQPVSAGGAVTPGRLSTVAGRGTLNATSRLYVLLVTGGAFATTNGYAYVKVDITREE